jgi:peptide/nickel transport system permease protein
MAKKLISGIAYLAFTFLIISIISFLAIRLAPNSFMAGGELNPNMTPEALSQLQAVYGLDKPLSEQYFGWLNAIAHLDFGVSFASGKNVSEEIFARLPLTLAINLISMAVIFICGVLYGMYLAFNADKKADKIGHNLSVLSYAMPSFYLSLIFIMCFGVWVEIFPISGAHSVGVELHGFLYYLDYAWHLALPILVIVLTGIGPLALYARSLTLEILKSDYIFFAKSRGIKGYALIKRFVLPNLSPPLITMLGLSLPAIIGGSVILESIFALNGMGLYFYQATLSRDYPVIMGITMIGAFLTLIGNLSADIILSIIDPFAKEKQ